MPHLRKVFPEKKSKKDQMIQFSQTLPKDVTIALIKFQKDKGVSTLQEVVRLFVVDGLKTNAYLPKNFSL